MAAPAPHVHGATDYLRDLNSFPDLVVLGQLPCLTIIDVSDHAVERLGWTAAEWIGRPLTDFGDPDYSGLTEALIKSALDGETVHFDLRFRAADERWHTYNFAARAIDDERRRFLLTGREMEALAHSHSQLAALLKLADLTDDIFVVTDHNGLINYANDAARRIHGTTEFVGHNVVEFVHEDDEGLPGLLEETLARRDRAEARVLGRRADGTPVPFGVRSVFDPESQQWFTVERDISRIVEQEKRMRELTSDLRRQATTDVLTGVANRAALNEILEGAVQRDAPFALLLLDMDDFKSVNDTMGHAAGDEFLRCVAQRMQRAVKLTDVVARLGGDEFVVFLPGIDSDAAALVASRMIKAVGQHYSIDGKSLTRSCSIGVAVREAGDDVSTVLRKADRAAYRAKHEGRSRFVVF